MLWCRLLGADADEAVTKGNGPLPVPGAPGSEAASPVALGGRSPASDRGSVALYPW